MKTYLKLFLAGAIGAIVGGTTVSHYMHDGGVWSHCLIVFGVLGGCFAASFAFDHKGTMACVEVSAKKALPVAWEVTSLVLIVIGALIVELGKFLIKASMLILTMAVMCGAWTLIHATYIYRLDDALNENGNWTSLALAAGIVSAISATVVWYTVLDKRRKDDPCLTFVEHGVICLKTLKCGNPLGAMFFALKAIFTAVTKIPAIVMGITYFAFLFSLKLTECRMRTAAIVGAGIGSFAGVFVANPLFLGAIGGACATLAHYASVAWRDSVRLIIMEIEPEWVKERQLAPGWKQG